MSIVKITDLPDVIRNNGDGSELGQIVQGDDGYPDGHLYVKY